MTFDDLEQIATSFDLESSRFGVWGPRGLLRGLQFRISVLSSLGRKSERQPQGRENPNQIFSGGTFSYFSLYSFSNFSNCLAGVLFLGERDALRDTREKDPEIGSKNLT